MRGSHKDKFGTVIFENDDMAACAFYAFFNVEVNGFFFFNCAIFMRLTRSLDHKICLVEFYKPVVTETPNC